MPSLEVLSIYLIVINLVSFIAMGLDKFKARTRSWRIPERTLMALAIVGGSLGALAGIYFFRHKTRVLKFKWGVPIILVLQLVLYRALV